MGRDQTSFKISTIRGSGDKIDDAVNMWVDANGQVNDAWLPFYALGIAGEEARIGYEEIRHNAIGRLNEAVNRLITVRETVYSIADNYGSAESRTKDDVKRSPGLTHRPDI